MYLAMWGYNSEEERERGECGCNVDERIIATCSECHQYAATRCTLTFACTYAGKSNEVVHAVTLEEFEQTLAGLR